MAKIKIKDIQPTGADLFQDSENFLSDLDSDEMSNIAGGLIIDPVTPVTDPIKTLTYTVTLTKTLTYTSVIL